MSTDPNLAALLAIAFAGAVVSFVLLPRTGKIIGSIVSRPRKIVRLFA
ncbi:MAG: hypothetical protein AAFY99_14140 [Pseudomonadota bacterium]